MVALEKKFLKFSSLFPAESSIIMAHGSGIRMSGYILFHIIYSGNCEGLQTKAIHDSLGNVSVSPRIRYS